MYRCICCLSKPKDTGGRALHCYNHPLEELLLLIYVVVLALEELSKRNNVFSKLKVGQSGVHLGLESLTKQKKTLPSGVRIS